MLQYSGEDRIISSQELLEELKEVEDGTLVIKTHIPSLDRILNGVEAGELVIVTGPTGEGKTTLLMTITANMIEDGVNSAWFTLEVTPRQFIQKMIKGGSTDKVPLFYLPRKNTENSLKWIEDRIVEAKVKHGVKAVFIDHIHQIFNLERVNNNISLELGEMVGKIKDIAITHDLIIFLIAHTKDNPTNSAAEPRKEDIRDSGLISRLADTIVGVWRVPNGSEVNPARPKRETLGENDTWSKVRIFKNRREGKLGTFLMNHKDHKLVEIDEWNGY
jgi:replicative DNA helicase